MDIKSDISYLIKEKKKICRYWSGSYREKWNTASIDVELLAIRYALESFELFILGKEEFTIRTDCTAIVKYYNKMKTEKNRSSLNRWHNLTSYIIEKGLKHHIEHIIGENYKIVDILSRLLQFE